MDILKYMGKRKAAIEKYISGRIRLYGSRVLDSPEFGNTADEVHHRHSSLEDHTLNVTIAGAKLCRRLNKMHIDVDEKDVIQASLCHDLGMIDRDEKYDTDKDAWKRHPAESVKSARRLLPGMSRRAESIILTHMWPICGERPRSREAVVVSIADKYASVIDWVGFFIGHDYKKNIKSLIKARA